MAQPKEVDDVCSNTYRDMGIPNGWVAMSTESHGISIIQMSLYSTLALLVDACLRIVCTLKLPGLSVCNILD